MRLFRPDFRRVMSPDWLKSPKYRVFPKPLYINQLVLHEIDCSGGCGKAGLRRRVISWKGYLSKRFPARRYRRGMGGMSGYPYRPPSPAAPKAPCWPWPPRTRNTPPTHNLRYNCTILAGYSQRRPGRWAIRDSSGVSRKTPQKKGRNRPVAGSPDRRIGARYGPGWAISPGPGG